MILREELENRECEFLAEGATKAALSKGRAVDEPECNYRTSFQRDKDRIIHSKSFRRLMHKTQVFLAPEGDHFRTRLTHTLEVSQIARTISRALGMNEDLTEAIALGHDLGHTPFGHNGEDFLSQRHSGGFKHNIQGLRVVDILESQGSLEGMNLTAEVRDGIVNHTGQGMAFTPEGRIVRYSDRIAYINHDIDDALRSNVISNCDLPQDCIEVLGSDHRSRINNLVGDIVSNSNGQGYISMSQEKLFHMNKLRDFMFENVYRSNKVKEDQDLDKIKSMIFTLYDFFEDNPHRLPSDLENKIPDWGIQEVVKDHIAGMTDRYALNTFKEIIFPRLWK